MTHRIHAFYEKREDVLTDLRVHPIPGVMDYFDYSPLASGMTFYDDLNLAGYPIDGVPDPVARGQFTWEMVTGGQGTLVITMVMDTDIPNFDYTSYYSDDETPSVTQCTGDRYEYGASGFWEDDQIPNTDPAVGAHYTFRAHRLIAYGGPGEDVAFAQGCAAEALRPLAAAASPYTPEPHGAVAEVGESDVARLWIRVADAPVRGSSEIRLVTASPGRFTLSLYDVHGRMAASIADAEYAPGKHVVAVSFAGIPAGVYFVRAVRSDGGTALAKVAHLQ